MLARSVPRYLNKSKLQYIASRMAFLKKAPIQHLEAFNWDKAEARRRGLALSLPAKDICSMYR